MNSSRSWTETHREKFVSFTLYLAALVLSFSACRSAQAAAWTTNSPMTTARSGHAAILLHNGKVLLVGGADTSVELYDPATGLCTPTGPMKVVHGGSTATLLPDGKVLVVGGNDNSAELYDPAAGTWTNTDALNAVRRNHTATLLPNGKVLVAGGFDPNASIYLNSAEIYDTATRTWTTTGSLINSRMYHTATLLPDGKVLVAGGLYVPSSTAELYDPANETWSLTGAMKTPRYWHTATLLPNGKVLVAGGLGYGTSAITNGAELYDPSAKTWTSTGAMKTAREHHTATLLPNGQLLVAGGSGTNGVTNKVELFNSSTGTWLTTNSLNVARQYHTATMLPNGEVFVAGGNGGNGAANSVEVFDTTINPPTGTNTPADTMMNPLYKHVATLLPNGKVLVSGGYQSQGVPTPYYQVYDPLSGWTDRDDGPPVGVNQSATLLPNGTVLIAGGFLSGILTNAEIYSPSDSTWTVTGEMNTARDYHTATLLFNGKVLVAGGNNASGSLANAELFDPSNGTWTVTGSMTAARAHHTATLLPNGKVLVAGITNFSELYDPVTGNWTMTGTMIISRWSHTATLLNNGKVLVAGGVDTGTNILSSAELYDPLTGAWAATGSMTTNRMYHTATLLPNGKVLVTGGTTNLFAQSELASEELYDPVSGTWTNAGAMTAARGFHTATLLANGKVLIAGGYNSSQHFLSSAELYDIGLAYSNKWQPQITSFTSPLYLGGSLVVTGAQFRGISEGSSGNSQDSSADYPLVQLRSIESGQTVFLLSTNWSTNSFASSAVWNFPPGLALATVFVNGIQSTSSIVNISVPVPATTTLNSTALTNGQFQFGFTNNSGTLFGVLTTTNLSLPLTNWTKLGGVVEVSPGQFQFTDPQVTTNSQRFYRAFAP